MKKPYKVPALKAPEIVLTNPITWDGWQDAWYGPSTHTCLLIGDEVFPDNHFARVPGMHWRCLVGVTGNGWPLRVTWEGE